MYFESDTVKSDCPVQIFRKMMKYLKNTDSWFTSLNFFSCKSTDKRIWA